MSNNRRWAGVLTTTSVLGALFFKALGLGSIVCRGSVTI